jgi:hypothetical protein
VYPQSDLQIKYDFTAAPLQRLLSGCFYVKRGGKGGGGLQSQVPDQWRRPISRDEVNLGSIEPLRCHRFGTIEHRGTSSDTV